MTKKNKNIEVSDVEHAECYVFRVIEFEGTGTSRSCKRSLPCRMTLDGDGYKISFFGPHALRDAERNEKPLTAIPVECSDLVRVALDKADEIWKEWLAGIRG